MPPDPLTYDDAVSGVDAVGWRASMAEERRSLIEHGCIRVGRPASRHSSDPVKVFVQVEVQPRRKALPTEVESGSARIPRG